MLHHSYGAYTCNYTVADVSPGKCSNTLELQQLQTYCGGISKTVIGHLEPLVFLVLVEIDQSEDNVKQAE